MRQVKKLSNQPINPAKKTLASYERLLAGWVIGNEAPFRKESSIEFDYQPHLEKYRR